MKIAYWTLGEGSPLVIMPTLLTSHGQLEWRIPEYRSWYWALAEGRHLIGYDARGNGMSEREVGSYSIDALIGDLNAVLERTSVDRFDLLAMVHSGPAALAFAAQHPDRVRHLALWGAYARAADYVASPRIQASRALLAKDWDAYVETVGFYSFGWRDEAGRTTASFIRETVSQEGMLRALAEIDTYDVSDILSSIKVPTLVLNRAKAAWPTIDVAQGLAAAIPNARLAIVPGSATLPWGDEVVSAIRSFFDESDGGSPAKPSARTNVQPEETRLSKREREVLRLLAEGNSNKEIAAALTLSVFTVERHLVNIYAKIGARGRADATAWALKNGVA